MAENMDGAIVKFTFLDKADGTTLLSPSALTVTVDLPAAYKAALQSQNETLYNALATQLPYENSLTIPATTYTADDGGEGIIYLAIPDKIAAIAEIPTFASYVDDIKSNIEITLTATVGDDTYKLTQTGFPFVNGQYHRIKAKMKKQAPEGAIDGKFTINSNGNQVYFSQGNLQATCTAADGDGGTQETWTWAFAEHQYDYVGNAVANTAIDGNGSVSTAGTVDLFGWSTAATYFGINNSTDEGDYSGDFVDWGSLAITNGGNTANSGWRMLTSAEWTYLFDTRTASTVGGTDNGRYAKATVNGVSGVILFPDSYTHPDGVTAPASVNTNTANFTANSYDATAWGKMETAGAVFLPAARYRSGSSVLSSSYTEYWSSSPLDASSVYYVYISESDLAPQFTSARYYGRLVRLVRAAE